MKISVIVPVYNVSNYLNQCIQSILSQSFKDFELIVVDDGSTDDSLEKCERWVCNDNRINLIKQSNQGLSKARNSGIRVAKGDYLVFVDSDDWIEPDMFSNMVHFVETQHADIVVCRGQIVEANGTISRYVGYDSFEIMTGVEATKEILKDEKMQSYAWNKIYKRELFDGIEYPVGRIFEDTATTYKLFYKCNKVVCIPYVGYNYRMNPNSITHEKRTDIQKFIKRELDNALAFHERYVFAKKYTELNDVVPICAFKAYQMIISFIHLAEHKKFNLTEEQSAIIEKVLSTMDLRDLSLFSMYRKFDLILFRINKKLLKLYLRIIAIIKPLKYEIK